MYKLSARWSGCRSTSYLNLKTEGAYISFPLPNLYLLTGFRRPSTRDINKAEPFLPRDYLYRSFPKIAELPDETKPEFIETFGPLFVSLVKLEVRIQQHEIAIEPMADTRHP